MLVNALIDRVYLALCYIFSWLKLKLHLLITLIFLLTGCHSNVERLNAPVVNELGILVSMLDTRIEYPNRTGPFPVALLLHGSSAGDLRSEDQWENERAFLIARGYAVVSFMRRGRGGNSGISAEYEQRHCEEGAWEQGLNEANEDVDAVIKLIANHAQLKNNQILLWGVSRGGFLAVRYSATGKYRSAVKHVINFAGGWVAQNEDRCVSDFNLVAWRQLGSATKVPTLWLYGKHDLFYGEKEPRRYFEAYVTNGGVGRYYEFSDIPDNGHWIFKYPKKWAPVVTNFLIQ